MSYIDIIPIGEVEEALLLFLKQSIFQTFKIQTRIRNRRFNLSSIYDPGRNQYNSSGLLLELINDTPPETFRILGVTELDLFIPILYLSLWRGPAKRDRSVSFNPPPSQSILWYP